MNKNVVIAIIVLIVIGVGAYFFTNKSAKISDNQVPAAQNKQNSATETIQGTIKSLLSSGKSQKCTYSNKLESASMEGAVYIANGKMRGDFISGTEEKKINGHMIVDGKNSYVWTDLSKQGMKMVYDPNDHTSVNTPESNDNQTLDINETFTYTCQGWVVDNSVFTPPSDISFSEFVMPSISVPSSGTEVDQSNCSICNNLPEGAAKEACKTQLNCE